MRAPCTPILLVLLALFATSLRAEDVPLLETLPEAPGPTLLGKPLSEIRLRLHPTGRVPPDRAAERFAAQPPVAPYDLRHWQPASATWASRGYFHQPFYFHNRRLELWGRARHIEPVCSGAHFLGSLLALPVRTSLEPPGSCQWSGPHDRPCACFWCRPRDHR